MSLKSDSILGVFRGAFERAVRDAKIFNFTFHDTRHTFASELIMKGVDIKTVQEYLGHSSVAVTQRYLHIAPDQKRTSIQLLDRELCDNSVTIGKEGQKVRRQNFIKRV